MNHSTTMQIKLGWMPTLNNNVFRLENHLSFLKSFSGQLAFVDAHFGKRAQWQEETPNNIKGVKKEELAK